MRYGLALVALAVCLSACGDPRGVVQTPRGAVIDGWPVGAETDCAAIGDCDDLIRVATDGLAARDSIRPDALNVSLHDYRQDQDGVIRSGGPPLIAVFQMGDGSLRAIGVKLYPGNIPPRVIDFGP